MYSHVRALARTVPTLTAWCNREPSWKLTLSTRQPASLSDQPTDVIQRRSVLPQPCKTIRLRSHCWGSHYLALSIGETIFGTRTNTHPVLFPSWISPPLVSERASRTQGNGLATRPFSAWPVRKRQFPFLFLVKVRCTYYRCSEDNQSCICRCSLSDPRALRQFYVTEQTGYLPTRVLLLEINHKETLLYRRRLSLFSRARNSFWTVDRKYFEKINEKLTAY